MKAKKISRISIRLVVGLLLLASTFAAAVTPARAEPSGPDRNWKWYERNVMKRMMNRDLYLFEMAKVCLTQATHPELLSLCQRLIDTLPQEIETLQAWELAWYDFAYTPRLTLEQRAFIRHLGIPRLKGTRFEIQSMRQERVMLRRNSSEQASCADHALHPDLAAFCAQATVSTGQDFRSVSQWLCNWYERCLGGIHPAMLEILDEGG